MKLNRSLFGTPKFQKFMLKVGDRQKALGILADLYILAKFYYLPKRLGIPQFELIEYDIPIETLMKLGFLEKEVEGYYMTGSEITFSYYFEDYFNAPEFKKAAGKASAKSTKHHAMRDPHGRFVPRDVVAELEKTKPRGMKMDSWMRKKLGFPPKKKVVKKKAKRNVEKSVDKPKAVRKAKKKGSTKRTRSHKH